MAGVPVNMRITTGARRARLVLCALVLLAISPFHPVRSASRAFAQGTNPSVLAKLSPDIAALLQLPVLQRPLTAPIIMQGTSLSALKALLGMLPLPPARDLALVNGVALDIPLGNLIA
jgi:hypothetical protein